MRLAILGTRGVPPRYGGFETFAAELGTRLVARGHRVTVYCRGEDRAPTWNGIDRIVLPAIGHKYFETVSHAFLSSLDAFRRDFDAVLLCNAANAFAIPILRMQRLPVAINVDGIERKRRKWNVLGRMVYAAGEAFSTTFASAVVADAEVIADYYKANYAIDPVMIPYGAEFPEEDDSDVLSRLGLRPRSYLLYVSRFEPENNPLEVVEAYGKVGGRGSPVAGESSATGDQRPPVPPLVMLGSGLYAPDLVQALHSHAGPNILFPGALYGADYRTLQRNALLYIQATEVGGTHPAMIEAMASGGAVLAHDTPENREVGADSVGYFELRPRETLSGKLREWLADEGKRESFRGRARRRAAERFGWDRVTDAYERLFFSLIG